MTGKPVAMLVTFIARETAYTWKIAHDEAFARFSPGAQLMCGGSTPVPPPVTRWSITSGRIAWRSAQW
jgi:hypothetical protein